jgi:competence protein ComEC
LGTWVALFWQQLIVYEIALLPLFVVLWRRHLVIAFFVITLSFGITILRVRMPSCGQYQGTAVVEVLDRRLVSYHGHASWKTMICVRDFSTDEGKCVARGVTLFTSSTKLSLRGGRLYQITGQLIVDDTGAMRLRIPNTPRVQEVGSTFSFVEWRVKIRRQLEQLFVRLFPQYDVRLVAGALTFGLSKDPVFSLMMHRAGIEHVLAISGFHFGIVAALTLVLSRFIVPRWRALVVMSILTAYLVVIGPLPSVIRAYCSAMMMCCATLFQRESTGLNCLGAGLIATTCFDPLFVSQVGFQLSFLATFAILLFSREVLSILQKFFPKRSHEELCGFGYTERSLYYILQWSCQALCLLVPVFFVIVPYQIAFFQQIFFLSLIYNLFIPFLFSCAMPVILIGVGLSFLPYIPSILCGIAGWILQLGIVSIMYLPETSWAEVRPSFPGVFVHVFLGMLLFFSFRKKQHEAVEFQDAWKACL